jgi:hypothetical protein
MLAPNNLKMALRHAHPGINVEKRRCDTIIQSDSKTAGLPLSKAVLLKDFKSIEWPPILS